MKYRFLDAISSTSKVLEAGFESSVMINHNASKGAVREYVVSKCISPFLPMAYGVAGGECFDYLGNYSRQMDIVIYDKLYSYVIPFADNFYQFPYESVYGAIEIKSNLTGGELQKALENVRSFKCLKREVMSGAQILPNRVIDIDGVNWNNNVDFYSAFGIIFAYKSVSAETVIDVLSKADFGNKEHFPDLIVLYEEKTIIFKAIFEDKPKFGLYPRMNGIPQGYVAVKCNENTLPFFIASVLSYSSQERIFQMPIENALNDTLDETLRNWQEMKYTIYN